MPCQHEDLSSNISTSKKKNPSKHWKVLQMMMWRQHNRICCMQSDESYQKNPCLYGTNIYPYKDIYTYIYRYIEIEILIHVYIYVFIWYYFLIFFLLVYLKDNFTVCHILDWFFFFQHFQEYIIFSSCLHCFWWDVLSYSYILSLFIYNNPFLYGQFYSLLFKTDFQ
jgi:hypothetical protein